jgi:hypothetical protein
MIKLERDVGSGIAQRFNIAKHNKDLTRLN